MATLRNAQPSDAASIAHVHVAVWNTTYRGLLPDSTIDSRTVEERTKVWGNILNNSSDSNFTLVVEHNASIVGFVSAGVERTKSEEWSSEVYSIYLLAEHQGQGFGRMLFDAATQRLAVIGHTNWRVWVLGSNTLARGFYERLGGQEAGHKIVTFDGEDHAECAYGWRLG